MRLRVLILCLLILIFVGLACDNKSVQAQGPVQQLSGPSKVVEPRVYKISADGYLIYVFCEETCVKF
jgi:hypothetical protein